MKPDEREAVKSAIKQHGTYEIIDKISAEVAKLVAAPDTKEKLAAQGFEPFYNNPQQTAALVKRDIDRFGKIIKEAGIKTEH